MSEADPAAEVEAPPRDLRAEYHAARRACSPKQRKWLTTVYSMAGQKWAACRVLGYSTDTIWRWLREERIKVVLALQAQMAELDHDLTRERILQQYERLAFSDMRNLYDPAGELKLPKDWDDATAAAVIERSFDANGDPKVKLHEKRGALDAIARIQGVLVDRSEITIKDAPAPVIHIVERVDPD